MQRVLLTGMSGVGKSTIAAALRDRGVTAIDLDDGWCRTAEDGEWLWDEALVDARLATEDTDVLFLAGSASNQVGFYRRFDHIVLLSAPREVVNERLRDRTTNPYGRSPEERRKALSDLERYEPMMRRAASHEITTTRSVGEIVDELLDLTARGP